MYLNTVPLDDVAQLLYDLVTACTKRKRFADAPHL